MEETFDGFLAQWDFTHQMTKAFVDAVPDEHWLFSPHPRFAPFAKQLRHVVCVRGAYNEGIATGATDFARKHDHYDGPLDRSALLTALDEKQQRLHELLKRSPSASRSIDFGGRDISLEQFTYIILQHEAIHLGEWSVYAALAGFETPLMWRLQWGL